MKFSYNWLKELSGTKKSPEELSEFLTLRAFEVEDVISSGGVPHDIMVGEVLAVGKHPNADRLRIATVSLGEGQERTIVCGAPNLLEGQKVAVALPGAMLPGGVEIREASIRGIDSSGMLCSEKELGLGANHEGILVLDERAVVGTLLSELLGHGDSVLDVKILPDRAHDCLSHVGLAREIAALEGNVLDYDMAGLSLGEERRSVLFDVRLDAKEKSRRYIGAMVRGVSTKLSPKWLSSRLETLGIRSINAIVDATNYVMLELGQPLHAFDWKKIAGKGRKTIGPRLANPGERITLLDGAQYKLSEEDVVIADEERALALAGIMGGSDSAVTEETTEVLIEAAHFDPVSIRRTRTRLGIRTDASDRFEKGISEDMAERAMVRVLEILTHIAGGEVMDTHDMAVSPIHAMRMTIASEEVSSLLGIQVSDDGIAQALELRGFGARAGENRVRVVVPPFRLDIESPEDVIEEVGKQIGYGRIESVVPLSALAPVSANVSRLLDARLLDASAANGFSEVYNYSFYSALDAERARLPIEKHYELANPLNPDQRYIRVSLVPNLLSNVFENAKHFDTVSLVENGRAYEMGDVPRERRLFSGILWKKDASEDGAIFFALKQLLVRVLGSVGLGMGLRVEPDEESLEALWHPARTAKVFVSGMRVGTVGEIHPMVSRAFGIRKRVAAFEIDREVLRGALPAERHFHEIPRYPEVLRDVSFFVSPRLRVSEAEQVIREAGGEMVRGVELFDRYADEKEGVSMAFHIRLRKEEGTLSGQEADLVLERITGAVSDRLGGRLRV